MVLSLVEEEDANNDECRVDHTNTMCIFCGGTKTSRWLKYRDDKGNWDKKSYECNSCYKKMKRYGTINDTDKNMKNIERAYAISHSDIGSGITIAKYGKKWEKFRIDEKPFIDTYKNLLCYFKDKKFNLENIRKWLSI
jgi:hypothetical protein